MIIFENNSDSNDSDELWAIMWSRMRERKRKRGSE